MIVLAIDPGNEQSAWVLLEDGKPIAFNIELNYTLLSRLMHGNVEGNLRNADHLAVEMIASYGMAVGREVFETCIWVGRFVQAWCGPHTLVYRREVKMHLCGNNAAKDANIRAALIDRFGPGKDKAIGKKATPGPLFGVSADVWSALAVAVTWSDTHAKT